MDGQTNVTQRKLSRFRPLHSYSLRTLFVVVTVAPVDWMEPVPNTRTRANVSRRRGGILRGIWKLQVYAASLAAPWGKVGVFDCIESFLGPRSGSL